MQREEALQEAEMTKVEAGRKRLKDNVMKEINTLKNQGTHAKDMVGEWVKRLKESFGDKFNKDNLKLSGHAMSSSMGLFWVDHV